MSAFQWRERKLIHGRFEWAAKKGASTNVCFHFSLWQRTKATAIEKFKWAQHKWLKHLRNPDRKHHIFISSKSFISWKMVRLCARFYRAYEIHIHLCVMKSSGSSADLSQTMRCSLGLAVWKSKNCNHYCMSHFKTLHLFYGHHSVVMAKWMN